MIQKHNVVEIFLTYLHFDYSPFTKIMGKYNVKNFMKAKVNVGNNQGADLQTGKPNYLT